MIDKLKEHHDRLRADAALKLYELYEKAVEADASYQKNKPERLKEIDDVLNTHIFKKLFT